MKLLSVANFKSYGESNTALHRHKALSQIFDNNIEMVDTSFKFGLFNRIINKLFNKGFNFNFFGINKLNEEIIRKVSNNHYNIIWIDKGIAIKPSTLEFVKKNSPNTIIIGYSPDEMTRRHNQSSFFLASLPLYDAYITTKSYAVNDLLSLGAKKVYFVNNAFESTFHYPREICEEDKTRLGGDIGFIGMWEHERANSIISLAQKGLNVRVWGAGNWLQYKDKYPNLKIEANALFSEDYAKALRAFKINLCFLRKINFDQQTTRSVEIPACGGFMLAEKTIEHQNLFKEGIEADFFSNDEELFYKCVYYLNNEASRESIQIAGYNRCILSGYSNKDTLIKVINYILSDYNGK